MATPLTALQTLFAFDDEDINVNRAGKLSERQKALILKELDDSCIGTAAAAFTIPVMLLLIGAFFWLLPSLWIELNVLVAVAVFGWLLLTFIAIQAVWRFLRWMFHWFSGWEFVKRWFCRSDMEAVLLVNEGMVATYRGRLTFADDGKRVYAMVNGEIAFSGIMAELDERLLQIEPESDYVIYFVPEFFWIVSVEPMV